MKTLLLGALIVVAFASNSFATSVNFVDNSYFWGQKAGWSGTAWDTDQPNGGWNGNTSDVIGDPNITGGTAQFTTTGRLQSVSFNYYLPYDTASMLSPGNLFINVLKNSSDTKWDYVVNTMGTPTVSGNTGSTASASSYNVYDVSAKNISAQRNPSVLTPAAITAANLNYVLSGQDVTGPWSGYIIRDDHPIGITQSVLDSSTNLSANGGPQASFSGFPGTLTSKKIYSTDALTDASIAGRPVSGVSTVNHLAGTVTYDFSRFDGGLDLGGKNIILAWETTCANDVIYEQVNNPVPEPGTMVLLGFGMLGMAIFGKRRMNKEA